MTNLLSETDATGKAKVVLDEIKSTFGMVPNFFKAQGAVDPNWLEINWNREKSIMLSDSTLDRRTRELIAVTVSLVNKCEYCTLAHETMAMMAGATQEEINEVKKVVELFSSFNSIADTLRVPIDITPDIMK